MKRWPKRTTPKRAQIREHKQLRVFGSRLHDPGLWHLNRRSVAGAFAVQTAWRWNLVRRLRGRRTRYRVAASGLSTPSSRRQT